MEYPDLLMNYLLLKDKVKMIVFKKKDVREV